MKRVIRLLQEKNRYLEEFSNLNEDGLARFRQGNFDNLDGLYETREYLLKMIKIIDAKLDETTQGLKAEDLLPEFKTQVQDEMRIKDKWVNKIVSEDLDIISLIEKAKSEIIRELQETKKNRKGIGGYKAHTERKHLDEKV